MISLTLFSPGLLASKVSTHSSLRSLQCLLSKSTVSVGETSLQKLLQKWFVGLSQSEIPFGALGALARGYLQKGDSGFWCRADLVECQLDHTRAYLLGNEHLSLSIQDDTELSSLLNHFLQQDSLKLHCANPKEWYLKINDHADVLMNDLFECIHADLTSLLPSGPQQDYWHKLLTECQMLLMSSNVHEKLIAPGNNLSLWFWGNGKLPDSLSTQFDHILSNDSVFKGLADCAECLYHPLDDQYLHHAIESSQNSNILLADMGLYVLHQHQMMYEWEQRVHYFESAYFQPILKALSQGKIDNFTLICADGKSYRVSKSHLKYFWRRVRPLTEFQIK